MQGVSTYARTKSEIKIWSEHELRYSTTTKGDVQQDCRHIEGQEGGAAVSGVTSSAASCTDPQAADAPPKSF
jgi:hypothetical protein